MDLRNRLREETKNLHNRIEQSFLLKKNHATGNHS